MTWTGFHCKPQAGQEHAPQQREVQGEQCGKQATLDQVDQDTSEGDG